MRGLLQTSTLLLGAILSTFAQAEAHGHLHAHEVRSPAKVFPNLKRDTELLGVRDDDDSYGGKGKHAGNGGWNGGSYEYKGNGEQDGSGRNGGQGQSETTITVDVTEIATEGMSTAATTGDLKTTIMETMSISAASVAKGSGQQGGQTA